VAKEDLIEMEGAVVEALPGGMFDIQTDDGNKVLGHLSGKLKMNHIRVLVGDRVTICVSPYDTSRGRITWRHKK